MTDTTIPGAAEAPKKKRGRPPKPRDPNAPPKAGPGRPRIPPAINDEESGSKFLISVMRGLIEPSAAQLKAAATLARLQGAPRGAPGLKEQRQQAAEELGGDFSPGAAPSGVGA